MYWSKSAAARAHLREPETASSLGGFLSSSPLEFIIYQLFTANKIRKASLTPIMYVHHFTPVLKSSSCLLRVNVFNESLVCKICIYPVWDSHFVLHFCSKVFCIKVLPGDISPFTPSRLLLAGAVLQLAWAGLYIPASLIPSLMVII